MGRQSQLTDRVPTKDLVGGEHPLWHCQILTTRPSGTMPSRQVFYPVCCLSAEYLIILLRKELGGHSRGRPRPTQHRGQKS